MSFATDQDGFVDIQVLVKIGKEGEQATEITLSCQALDPLLLFV